MRYRYWIFAMLVSLFASCSDDEILPAENGEEETSDLVTEVSVSCSGFTAGITRGTDGDDCCSACNACNNDFTCNGECANLTSDGDKKMVKNTCPEDDAYILGKKSFEQGDRIYILQKAPNLTPRFPGDFFDHRNDDDDHYKEYKEYNKLDNIYVYEYDRNDAAVWDNSVGGYNFKYNSKRSNPISWKTVKENGSIGNSFVFFAFCDNLKDLEPVDDPLLKHWNDTPGQVTANFGDVEYFHHAYGGKWKKSDNVGGSYDYSNDWHVYQYQNHCGVPDLLGAYHTTSSLYERLRFKFYHLLAYVRVTLYVPVVVENSYQEKDPETGNFVYRSTGYDDTAFVLVNDGSGNGTDAEINDYRAGVSIGNHNSNNRVIRTRFTIDWDANRTTDTYPITQTLDVANSAGFLYYYCMYFHNPLDITASRYKPKKAQDDWDAIKEGIGIEDLNVTNFVKKNANAGKYLKQNEKGEYWDQVRRYEFSAAMPAQSIPTSGTVGGKTATSTLVDIHVRAPGATDADQIYNGTKNNYHNDFAEYTLSTSRLFSENDEENKNLSLVFSQNTITHLYIYLPRVADEAILVNAEVLKWKDTHTDMAVSPDDWGE